MKPIKLIIEGVNSFDGRQELDFEAAGRSNLFCICGKTGAGKTTIFDSMLLALYGRCGKGNLADVVNLSRMSAFVSLEFDADGVRYRAERSIKCKYEKDGDGNPTDRRTATSECLLYKDGIPVAKGDEAAQLINNAVGLELGEFKNVYMLEQGEYAEFLKKGPAKQTEAVGKIFSLMRFGDAYRLAAEKKREAENTVKSIEERMRDLGDVTQDALRSARSLLSSLRAKNAALKKETDAVRRELDEKEAARLVYVAAAEKENAVKAHSARLREAQERLGVAVKARNDYAESVPEVDRTELETKRARLNELVALGALDSEYALAVKSARESEDAAQKKLRFAEDQQAAVRQAELKEKESYARVSEIVGEFESAAKRIEKKSPALDAAINALCVEDPVARVKNLAEIDFSLRQEKGAYDSIKSQKTSIFNEKSDKDAKKQDFLKKIEMYSADVKIAEEALANARAHESEAAQALEKARLGSHAAAVAAELADGDACPVCGGIYHGRACADGDVEAKKKEYEKASAGVKTAQETFWQTEKKLELARADYSRACDGSVEFEKKLSELDEKLTETRVDENVYSELLSALEKAKTPADAFTAARDQSTRAASAAAVAEAEAKAARETLKTCSEREKELYEKLEGGELCGKTGALIKEFREQIETAERAIAARDKKIAELDGEISAARSAAETVSAMLDAAIKECPVDMPEFDLEAYEAKKSAYEARVKEYAERETEIALKSAAADALAEKAEREKALDAERALYVKRADNYGVIADMTKSKAMLNYVAEEYIMNFTAIASDILGELSAGKYAMSYGADGFTVSDFLNDAKRRKTNTLSGGELFLASLAVAIAIARTVGSEKNAFFFLDEGFGTLDDDLIDTVYGALESLSRDCLVGVISHASALIERMPACVEVVEATDERGSLIKQ